MDRNICVLRDVKETKVNEKIGKRGNSHQRKRGIDVGELGGCCAWLIAKGLGLGLD